MSGVHLENEEEVVIRTLRWYRRRSTFVIAGGAAFFIALAVFTARTFDEKDLIALVDHLQQYGRHWWAPAALIGAVIVVNLTGLPGTPFTLASGAIWGWRAGGAWMMVATLIGTALPYFIARSGRVGVKSRLGSEYASTLAWIQRSGFSAVAVLRLAHVFPFALISYGAGLAGVRARDYFAGTLLGALPGVLIYAYLADSIISGMMSAGDAKQRILIAASLLVVFVLGTNLIARRMRQEREL